MTCEHNKHKQTSSYYLGHSLRNGKIVWKHGPNRPFFLYNLSSENYKNPVHASLHEIETKAAGNYRTI